MKKSIIFLTSILAMFSCAKDLTPVTADKEVVSTFTVSATKMTVGDKTADTYKALWADSDSLLIVSSSDESSVLGVAYLQSGAGQNKATFYTTAPISDGTSVKLIYGVPAVPSDQVQPSVGSSDLSSITRASSEAVSFVAGGNMTFSLTHSVALLKVLVSSSEFSALNLKGVAIYSASAVLSGNSEPYAEVTFDTPASLASPCEAWLATEAVSDPADFYVAAIMTGTYNGVPDATVSIPVKFTGKTLLADKVNVISLSDISMSSNSVSWYNPVCTRIIPLKGWCYGESNTIVLGNEVGDSVTADMRACGDVVNVLRYAREPKSLSVRMCDIVNTSTWNTFSIDGVTTAKNKVCSISLNPTIKIVNAISSSKEAVAGLFDLLDKDGNILWAFGIWGTPAFRSNVYNCGIEVMDRNIGGYDPLTGGIGQCRGYYYQWGRPFPFGYGAACQVVDLTFKVTDLSVSASHANSIATISDSSVATDWWTPAVKDDFNNDLWGNTQTVTSSTAGVKTVFDPCPKGWMVCCPAVLKEVKENAVWETSAGANSNINGLIYTINGQTDRWVNAAFYNGNSAGRGSNKGLYFCNAGCDWEQAMLLETGASGTDDAGVTAFKTTWRSNACSIRCMKDTANR